jgi:cysteine synthase A
MFELQSTRLIRLRWDSRIYAKLEFENPSGSHKDRAYAAMMKRELHHGAARQGDPVWVDYSTGNGAIAMATFARAMGHRAVAFMPDGLSVERTGILEALGAEVHATPHVAYVAGARRAAEEFARTERNAVLLNQSDNLANQVAFQAAGREILKDFEWQSVAPRAFVCVVGTGGTFSGIASELKASFPRLEAVAVEGPEAPTLTAKRSGHTTTPRPPRITGTGAGTIARNTDERLIDAVELVEYEEALEVMREIREADGIAVGPSSAANAAVARRCAQRLDDRVVTVFFDLADRYRSQLRE